MGQDDEYVDELEDEEDDPWDGRDREWQTAEEFIAELEQETGELFGQDLISEAADHAHSVGGSVELDEEGTLTVKDHEGTVVNTMTKAEREEAWQRFADQMAMLEEAQVQDEGTERSKYHRIGQPMCVACGRTIFECLLHDETDLEIIRRHELEDHRSCDSDACVEGEDLPLD